MAIEWLCAGMGTEIAKKILKRIKNFKRKNDKHQSTSEGSISGAIKRLGLKIKGIRELFGASQREFAYKFNIDIADLERYEAGKSEVPRKLIDALISDYRIEPAFIDDKSEFPFKKVNHIPEEIARYIGSGFDVTFITPPLGHADRKTHFVYTVLFKDDPLLPYCFLTSSEGSFSSNHGGKNRIFEVITGMNQKPPITSPSIPIVYCADNGVWDSIRNGTFYMRKPFCRGAGIDYEATDILYSWREQWFNLNADFCRTI